VATGALGLGVPAGASTASSHPPIGPNQIFGASVNGKRPSATPVVIKMACTDPLQPGQTGHPLAGQTLSVFRDPSTAALSGDTGGNGTAIGAFFGAPPPSAAATPTPSASYVSFSTYRTKKLPTSLTLPCSGSGHVVFVPLPNLPGARTISIPVIYGNVTATP
jgi:hypothetical protein